MTNAEAGSRTVQAGDAAFSYLDAGAARRWSCCTA